MSDNKDLTILNYDQELRQQIERGEITQSQVDAIWAATWDMSAQTPITVRRAVAAMREVTVGKTPEQAMALMFPMLADFLMTAATETQAALTRDESKFAHLVAGAETIVKTLQAVNPLEHRLERMEAAVDGIGKMLSKGGSNGAYVRRLQRHRQRPGKPDRAELLPDPEQEANEARRKTIGSAWAPDPEQGLLYKYKCPLSECDYAYSGYLPPIEARSIYVCFKHGMALIPA